MSSDATGWVYRHSTATGSVFQVHHAIADSANDQNNNEFWLTMAKLAVKARCTRGTAAKAVAWLEEQGFLELLSDRSGGRSKSARYRFLYPDAEVVYESRKVRADDAVSEPESARSEREEAPKVRADRARKEPKSKTNPRKEKSTTEPPTTPEGVTELCEHLAKRIGQHRQKPMPAWNTSRWLTDMRLLLERGPKDRASPEVLTVDRVRRTIDAIFDSLATPMGSDGFCWADQIQSPNSLRKQWDKLATAYKRAKPTEEENPEWMA